MTRDQIMKRMLLIGVLLSISIQYACTLQQPSAPPPIAQVPAHPLPFTGRLIDGNPRELPAAVALSLSNSSTVTFSYREELTHDDYHIPLWFSALDPVTYAGAPLGDYGVTAFASLSIIDGDRILGDYTAKAYVTKSYSLYSEPTHLELERAARADVREKIDQKLYADAAKLADAVGAGSSPSGASIVK
jgi:hypothetical protein